ncbi:MAG: MotA/TolQ/ExbB proton channel family protein [Planctomycetes bacterium]|nr:MotA/TolQ/ExbB proton channel family protein [Planctomycetota bacterium]
MNYFIQTVDLFLRGGMFMWPLLIAAIAAIVLIVERLLYLRENRINWDRFHFELKSALKENDLERATVLAAKTRGVIGRVMEECLLKIKAGETDVESATEKIILDEMSSMEKSRGWLAVIIQVSPLLGIIGTVQGMIVCFMSIEASATTDPKLLASGIYTALITTFGGLVVTIPTAVAQEYFRKEINNILHFMDLYLIEVREWQDKRTGLDDGHGKETEHALQHA